MFTLPLVVALGATMIPTKPVTDESLERSYETFVQRHPFARGARPDAVTLTALKLPFWKAAQVVLATGWTDGGHARTRPIVFLREGTTLEVLEVRTENVDENGTVRRVTDLLRCSLEGALKRLDAVRRLDDPASFEASAKLEQASCRSVWGELRGAIGGELTAAAGLLATLVDGAVPSVDVSAPSLKRLLANEKPPKTEWIGAPQPYVPWSVERKRTPGRASGMVQGGDTGLTLMHASLEVGASELRFELAHLAFERVLIR